MLIQRTANAGVLLQLDNAKILLDGVCKSVGPYLATPDSIRDALMADPPDILAFTHEHADHFHGALAEQYRKQTLRPILGPENLPYGTTSRGVAVGGVSILPVKSRHIGKEYFDLPHVSYCIRGSGTVWFLGDAAPLQWKGREEKADVIIAPFAYALSESAWRMTCSMTKAVVLVHMPLKTNDPAGLWPQVEAVTGKYCPVSLYIPEMGEILEFPD